MRKFFLLTISVIFLTILGLIGGIIYLWKWDSNVTEVRINHDMVLQQVEGLGNLEVVRYNIQDMMEYEKVRRWLPNSTTSLRISGEVIACVDLTVISADDIYTSGDSVSLVLPIPEICHYRVDHSRSQVYDIRYGFWESAELMDEAYKAAEEHIRHVAMDMGIGKESRENAIKVLTPILRGLGFTKIYIGFKSSIDSSETKRFSLRK